jgi:HK97 family phage major capsid protein
MALVSNNQDPNKTLTREDVKQIVKDAVGAAKAEMITDHQKQANKDLDDPTKAAEVAARAAMPDRSDVYPATRSIGGRFDPLATKDPAEMTAMERANMFVRSLQCQFWAQKNGGGLQRAIARAKEFGQDTLVKAMSATDFDSGGFLLQPVFAEGVIEELLARSVYLAAGPEQVDLDEGGMSIPYENDGADAQWAAEGVVVNADEIEGGQINLQPRELVTIVPVSDRMLRGAPGRNSQFITNSMLRAMKLKLDATLLRGVGANSEPNGLYGLMASGNNFSATALASLTQATLVQELLQVQTTAETNNIDLATDRPYYFMSPRTKNFLRAQRATDGRLFPEMEGIGIDGMLLSAGYSATSNIPDNVSASYSEIFFVAMAHMILGKTLENETDVFVGGSYNNSSGSLVSGISTRRTVIRMVGEWDHAAGQRGNEIARIDDVDWV